MRRHYWLIAASVIALAQTAKAEDEPVKLELQQEPSVYALPSPPSEEESVNAGGANVDIRITYLSDYLYRGVDVTKFLNAASGEISNERANFQFDGKIEFNLGKLPHPFIAVFANVLDQDPISTFQEVRPNFGTEWRVRPLILAAGNNTYIYPDRSELNTSEVFGKITLDDSILFHREDPLLSPYVYAAYDYDLYKGWYLEAGVSHDFVIERTGITLTVKAAIGAIIGYQAYAGPTGEDTGLHHYELGLIARYSLNELLNIPARYGQWSLNGYLYYDDGIDNDLRSNTKLWGGGGIQWSY